MQLREAFQALQAEYKVHTEKAKAEVVGESIKAAPQQRLLVYSATIGAPTVSASGTLPMLDLLPLCRAGRPACGGHRAPRVAAH
jgi:hypothetical protein